MIQITNFYKEQLAIKIVAMFYFHLNYKPQQLAHTYPFIHQNDSWDCFQVEITFHFERIIKVQRGQNVQTLLKLGISME